MYKVIRPKDTVIVDIFRDKITGKYKYINLTKRHICPCNFDTIEDAIYDMEKLKKQGKIISYTYIN